MKSVRYPSLHQINTGVWLTELSRSLGRRATRDDIPDAELGQQRFATILACSDSRVPPELVFDQGFGDLFIIRIAGNNIADDVVGSIGYLLNHLKTHLVVVIRHQGCGAVTAALEAIDGKGSRTEVHRQGFSSTSRRVSGVSTRSSWVTPELPPVSRPTYVPP